jgi:signal transduction histidine kinase/CheY-like chemotaxis protein/HPt (histidine-containing phosphotransfer) domain-containing protein
MAFAHGGRQGAGLAIGVTFFLGYLSLLGGELRRDFATSLLSARALEARAVEAERLARDLERASALARAASDAKSAFVANVSHELRTPLVSILGYADLLRSSAPGPEERDRSEVIHRNAKHLLALLNQVLDLSKVEAGRMTAEDRETNLRDLFEDIEQTFFLPAQEKGLGFEIRGEGAIPLYVRTDGTRLRQIVLNLTANAIKFTQQGKVQVVPSYEAASERLAVRIIDTGIGMTEGVRAQIFAPFAQADASIARQFGGTGLGLHLSRELARLLGGDVDVESSPDAGSTFTAWIRAAAAGAATCSIAPKTASAPRRQASRPLELHGMSILLAEDNADNQRLLSLQLAAAGAHVDVASDGEQVLELVARAGAPYDVILMDVQMPRLDGLEATRRLRASGYGGAVVALSAHVFAEERERMIAAGCDDCLGKPITRDDLVLAVRARRAPATAAIAPDATTDDSIPAGAEEEDVAEMLAVLREDFVRGLTATLVRLREAASRSDVTEIAYVAHQLRGAGGSFGFPEITRAGAQLEDSARGGRAIDAALAALERACDTAQQGSTALRSSPTR